MAIGTPVHHAAVANDGATVTTASFTPAANSQLIAFATGYRSAAFTGKPAITDSVGLTWTEVGSVQWNPAAGSRDVHYALYRSSSVGGSPAAMTVTATATSGNEVSLSVDAVTGASNVFSNFDTAESETGDPAFTLPAALSSGSAVMIWAAAVQGNNSFAQPAAYTETFDLTTSTPGGDDFRHMMCYDLTPANVSETVNSNNALAFGFILELKEAAAGGGIVGSASITEAGDTISAAATLALRASLAATEAGDSVSASAKLELSGVASMTEADDSLSATGSIASNSRTGAASITEADDALASPATLAIKAAAAITESDDTLSAAAGILIVGSSAIIEADDTVVARAVPILVTSPQERTVSVAAEERTVAVLAEIRTASVSAETRSVAVRSENRLAAA
ncbi:MULTISPECIES: hypothetical protein [unclassified Sinorhizobium]|uniref:hypothetical protein n=1 Tax=unclassified Sinorhizobium TaxID=2613772 RepID=UPI0024C410FA|nr:MULTISPECIES: hypothetical protein [unclassified Sinorhizobium]MDK1377108.1 hypothetical protein [Sinorhizobium sp. 6-70]MDK1479597.1 hypothetical protein [Sinorhizobium sp. 6-117]